MKGYRCDNCRDFAPERINPEKSRILTAPFDPRPEEWVTLVRSDWDAALHFCSHACVVAYAEREAAAVV